MKTAEAKSAALHVLREYLRLPHPPGTERPSDICYRVAALALLEALGYVRYVNAFDYPFREGLWRPELTARAETLSREAKERLLRGEWPEEEEE